MSSRFKDIRDYFKRIEKVTQDTLAWVVKATPKAKDNLFIDSHLLTYYVTPARPKDAEAWDELNIHNCVYVWRADGHRLHAAIVPLDAVSNLQAEGVKTHEGKVPFGNILDNVDQMPKRVITLNVKHLRDAIAPGADKITLVIPTDGPFAQPIEVASIEDEAQIGYAIITPYETSKGAAGYRVRRPDFRPLGELLKEFEKEGKKEQEEKDARWAAAEKALSAADEALGDLSDWRGPPPYTPARETVGPLGGETA